jgi:2-dehydro-3-deoxygluconokinase
MENSQHFDVIAIGETMAMLTPADGGGLESAVTVLVDIGGAESNVVMHMAGSGLRVAWASRVGNDPFGRRILDRVGRAGVDVSLVDIDDTAPTGVYFKDPSASGTTVHYYRAGSAAARMSAEWVATVPFAETRMVNLSGITPALSASCAEMIAAVFSATAGTHTQVSFDVNYRPALWPIHLAAPILAGLANQADIVFVGLDEAEVLWGTRSPQEVRQLLPRPGRLVVKNGAVGATEFLGELETFVPPSAVSVIEEVGAGDAFAAGYLAGMLAGDSSSAALERGHRRAASTVGTRLDV